MQKSLIILICCVLLAACSGGLSQADSVATIVAATLQAGQPPLPTAATGGGLVGLTGSVEGAVCFPSEGIPPMNIYLQLAGSAEAIVVPISQNQSSYNAELATGTYTAYAWLPDFSIGGSYSQAVSCGLGAECSNHSLQSFEVTAGTTTSGIDLCDWYGNPGDVPLPPGVEVQTEPSAIAGSLSYPSEMIPAMQVVAFSTSSSDWYLVLTNDGQNSFQIDNLPAGDYYVVAYLAGGNYGGGFTAAVACGLSVDCTDHSLVAVTVTDGQIATGINPGDWYAPENAFPPNPAP